ncbi:RNA polymerase sigma factor [uncultured Dysosmobacter sp.]|uniref:RNA polymerase sigma factor n=1 Tax=uncultured Dysosmobacter sp. TaxID=2591384 RepID=UPI00261C2C23|nr:sigma-70 family RNA polymerase sigma factor [uncultured Dysosmobacter sp.]
MEDKDIIALYWARSEEAIQATAAKYGGYCGAIIRRVLGDGRDGEECLNDTWLGAWNAIPPQRPAKLAVFLGRIARNTALDRYSYNTARRRCGDFELVLEELAECVGGDPAGEDFDLRRLGESISAYLDTVSPAARRAFLRRYWHCETMAEIGEATGYTQAKIRSLLHRTRKGLREYLIREGYDL